MVCENVRRQHATKEKISPNAPTSLPRLSLSERPPKEQKKSVERSSPEVCSSFGQAHFPVRQQLEMSGMCLALWSFCFSSKTTIHKESAHAKQPTTNIHRAVPSCTHLRRHGRSWGSWRSRRSLGARSRAAKVLRAIRTRSVVGHAHVMRRRGGRAIGSTHARVVL